MCYFLSSMSQRNVQMAAVESATSDAGNKLLDDDIDLAPVDALPVDEEEKILNTMLRDRSPAARAARRAGKVFASSREQIAIGKSNGFAFSGI